MEGPYCEALAIFTQVTVLNQMQDHLSTSPSSPTAWLDGYVGTFTLGSNPKRILSVILLTVVALLVAGLKRAKLPLLIESFVLSMLLSAASLLDYPRKYLGRGTFASPLIEFLGMPGL